MNVARRLLTCLFAPFLLTACFGDGGGGEAEIGYVPPSSSVENGGFLAGNATARSMNVDVGQGYDSYTHGPKPQYCIRPATSTGWPVVGVPMSSLSMQLQADRQQVAKSLGLDFEAKYLAFSAAASFLNEIKTDDRSTSYVFGGNVTFKDIQVGDSIIPDYFSTYDPVDWREVCGDSYIQSVKRGASLYTSMKFKFSSAEEKSKFEASMKLNMGLKSAEASLRTAQSTSSNGVSVTVSALQTGGEPAQLLKALKGVDVASCSMSDIQKCLEYLNSIEKYAETFANQFKDKNGQPLKGQDLDNVSATIDYTVASWTSFAQARSKLPGNRQAVAKDILNEFSKQFAMREQVTSIKSIPLRSNRGQSMLSKQAAVLDGDERSIDQNLAILDTAWRQCYPEQTESCQSMYENSKSRIKAIPAEDLQPWFDMVNPGGLGAPSMNDLVDIRVNGIRDYCYALSPNPGSVYWSGMNCFRAVGGGFVDTPDRVLGEGAFKKLPLAAAWIPENSVPGLNTPTWCGFSIDSTINLTCFVSKGGGFYPDSYSLAIDLTYSGDSNGFLTVKENVIGQNVPAGFDRKILLKAAASRVMARWPGYSLSPAMPERVIFELMKRLNMAASCPDSFTNWKQCPG